MSSLSYNNVNLSVNSSYIMAESINVTQSSPQKPIYSMNNSSPYDNTPSFIKGTISLSYYMEPGLEPNYTTVTGILNDITTMSPSIINIGGVTATGYLRNFSFQSQPNSLIKANASYDVFHDFNGNLIQQNPNDSSLYDTYNSSGISHYWAMHFYSGNSNVDDNRILQLSYSVDVNSNPIYCLGNPYPVQVFIANLTESLNVLFEQQHNVIYSGRKLMQNRPDLERLVVTGLNAPYPISFSMTGFIMQEMKYDISTNNLIFFNNTYSRSR